MRRDEITTGTPVQKGSASNKNYNSEITISIWPTTAEAIQEYINGERAARTSKGLKTNLKASYFLQTTVAQLTTAALSLTFLERPHEDWRRRDCFPETQGIHT